jgi:hypothetical protein
MWIASAALTLVASATGGAQGATQSDHWTFSLSPYGWLAGLNGTVAATNTPAVDVSAGFGDLVDHLDFGIAAAFEARRGPWSGILDGSYVELSTIGTLPTPGYTSAGVTAKTAFVNGALGFRVTPPDAVPLDVLAGARLWDVSNDLVLTGDGRSDLAASTGDTWVDPVVGARLRPEFGDHWFGRFLGDVGGFGAASDLTWQLYGAAGYRFSELFALSLGYRYLAVDYSSGGFVFDVKQQGVLFGLGLSF